MLIHIYKYNQAKNSKSAHLGKVLKAIKGELHQLNTASECISWWDGLGPEAPTGPKDPANDGQTDQHE